MTDQNHDQDWESMFAGLHANTAFVESIKHLQAITGSEKDSFSQALNRIGWMHVYIVAIFGSRLIERLDNLIESVDCAGAGIAAATQYPEFWMISEAAAIAKAKEIGLKIQHEWSIADLRYKLHQAIYGGDNG